MAWLAVPRWQSVIQDGDSACSVRASSVAKAAITVIQRTRQTFPTHAAHSAASKNSNENVNNTQEILAWLLLYFGIRDIGKHKAEQLVVNMDSAVDG